MFNGEVRTRKMAALMGYKLILGVKKHSEGKVREVWRLWEKVVTNGIQWETAKKQENI